MEPVIGDPDRVATIAPSFEHVSVACVLLGSAVGSADALAELHGSRLDMLLLRMLDTTIRGIVYEATGSVEPDLLAAGSERVAAACEESRIPYVLLDADPQDPRSWLPGAVDAVEQVLAGR